MPKPELLVPVGNIEAFYAALEAGADAIYLGLQRFNARERARNFTISQLSSIVSEATKHQVKIYITLNTLIKNNELAEIFDILYTLEKMSVDAVIIQDYGIYYLLRKYFPKLKIHASTQMGTHNSAGAEYCWQLGLERVILARELTINELTEIKYKTSMELEIFIHGALCYSFSGMCLFSSFLGGMSANRGNCCQPCRRKYQTEDQERFIFNLKDNQQLELISRLTRLGITAFKIEGRMKSAEYVYNATAAYRKIIDDPLAKKPALQLLEQDFGREKTSYFLGGNVKNSISEFPFTGIKAGEVIKSEPDLMLKTEYPLQLGDRLRILSEQGYDSPAFKVKKIFSDGKDTAKSVAGDIIVLPGINVECVKGDLVFLVNSNQRKFPDRLNNETKAFLFKFSQKRKTEIIKNLGEGRTPAKEELFVRINDSKWLRKLYLENIDKLILFFDQQQLQAFRLDTSFLHKIAGKLIIQLPRFIAEKNLSDYEKEIIRLNQAGIDQFMLSHLSQKLLFTRVKKVRLYTSENVYALNDAATSLLKEQQITNWIYPLENDFPNLISGNDRRGIVPLLFYPELFISRMPAGITDDTEFKDERQSYKKKSRNGLTIILPAHPVSLLQFHRRLFDKGFRRFLIDFSWFTPSTNTFNRILKNYQTSQPEQPATTFNFKIGLK